LVKPCLRLAFSKSASKVNGTFSCEIQDVRTAGD